MKHHAAFHVDGGLASDQYAEERRALIDTIRAVDSRLSGSLGPDWIISSWHLENETLYMAHCVRTQWSASARSVVELIRYIREQWTT